MIPNMWYAVLSSKDVVKNKITACTRFGERLCFFRDENGKAVCVSDQCAHRGASFKDGKIKNGCLKCPFHGIEYDADGKASLIPSDGIGNEKNLGRFNLRKYHSFEQDDIIYVYYSEREPQSFPEKISEISEKMQFDEIKVPWKTHYSRVIENQLDVSHLPFVHHNTIGRGNKTLANGPKVEFLDENNMIHSADNEVDHGQKPKSNKDAKIKETYLHFRWPNVWVNHISDKLLITACFIPVDDENSIIALRFYNAFTGFAPLDKLIAKIGSAMNRVVQNQDKVIVETQLPKKTGLKIGENLVQADRPIIEYRKRRQKLIDKAAAEENKAEQDKARQD